MEEKRLGLQQNFQDCKKNFKLYRGPKTSGEIEKERDWLDYRWTERQTQCSKDSNLRSLRRKKECLKGKRMK